MRTIDNPAQLKLDLFTSQPVNAQSDNIPEVRYLHPQPISSRSLKLADKLEKLAATMQTTIDSKLHPAIGQQNITARRSRIAAGMREEGERLALIQRWLEGLAQSHRTGTCPSQFANIDNRKQLADLASIYRWYEEDSKYLQDCFTYNYSIVDRLAQFSIKSKYEAIAAVKLLDSLCFGNPAPEIDRSLEKANELRRRAIYTKVPDFFPTPKEVIDRMLQIARIDSSHRVLDPSAGSGDLCLAIRKLGAVIDCFEINSDLHQALTLLDFQPLDRDFLFATPRPMYDRVLMNPPFSKDAYIDHVRAAYDWLAPGGELVAVLPSGYQSSRSLQRRNFSD
ncbi:class I SAM-dependent methyltransferase [Chamaesiphon sp. VAR_48_metabat_135_sub]|uniref:class I SAM-dependent methyltransferase n=1 Tax=Chamaesiphon sp. VAR_48_metabat_135_sub TaxID=2964699 RepID=UPI00286D445A|nr:class I SAM-dependent methyltransferase [Chamaesiphon sp. VAR_48_metabat_135_sub]